MWTTKKLAGKKHNIDPMWKVLMKVDLGEPTSFLDHVYLGVTQRERETSKDIVDNYRNIFESRISAGVKEKLLSSGRPDADISSLSYDVEGHAKKCVERYCELADKTTQQIYKSLSTPCLDDHLFEEEELGELSKVCSQIVLKCLYLSRIGRPDIPWSVNKLTQAVTNWTRACDRRLARLISYIHNTSGSKQYCHVGNTAKQCRLGLFQDSDFAGDLEDSKSTSGGTLCVFGSHTFVPRGWMCEKQTSVSHRSTEFAIITDSAHAQHWVGEYVGFLQLITELPGQLTKLSFSKNSVASRWPDMLLNICWIHDQHLCHIEQLFHCSLWRIFGRT